MSPSEINRVIAKHLGWKWKPRGDKYGPLVHPWEAPNKSRQPEIPDYYHDLNACHEMESYVNYGIDKMTYMENLADIVEREFPNNEGFDPHPRLCCFLVLGTTAPQRCEAFLRTVGKWIEEGGSK